MSSLRRLTELLGMYTHIYETPNILNFEYSEILNLHQTFTPEILYWLVPAIIKCEAHYKPQHL